MKVYCIENKINGKKYIGVTRGEIIGRFKQHKKLTRSQHKCHLHNAMLSHGIDNFIVYEIDKADTKEELFEKEKHWIKKLDTKNNGYNETDGGEGSWGWKPTEEQRKNNSERIKKYYKNNTKAKEHLAKKSKEYWNNLSENERVEKIEQFNKNKIGNQNAKGKTWTLSSETKNKISDARKGYKMSDETKKKLSEKAKLRTGRVCSFETKEKMRLSALQRKVGT